MKRLAALFLTPLLLMGLAGSAIAFPISGTHGKDEIRAKCAANGGDFRSNNDGYWCTVSNCDGKGGTCGVSCDTRGNCEGSVPPSRSAGLPKGGKLNLNKALQMQRK